MRQQAQQPRRLQARPTIYRGIHMRSRLEASYAALLDQADVTWEYEPQCFADATGQYLPDFAIKGDHRTWYVDVKPDGLPVGDLRRRMERVWSSDPTAMLLVWWPRYGNDTTPWNLFRMMAYDGLWGGDDCWFSVEKSHPKQPFPGCHPTPDSAGNYYHADDPERPF